MYETMSMLRPTDLRIRTRPALDLQKKSNREFESISVHAGCERYSNLITGLDRPWGFQKVEAPRFQDNQHMKVVRLSALGTDRLYPPGNIPGTHFCYRLSQLQAHSVAGRIMPMKNSSDTIGNRTCDVKACSAVPQPTAPPRAPTCMLWW